MGMSVLSFLTEKPTRGMWQVSSLPPSQHQAVPRDPHDQQEVPLEAGFYGEWGGQAGELEKMSPFDYTFMGWRDGRKLSLFLKILTPLGFKSLHPGQAETSRFFLKTLLMYFFFFFLILEFRKLCLLRDIKTVKPQASASQERNPACQTTCWKWTAGIALPECSSWMWP